jgi:hypothetical protein
MDMERESVYSNSQLSISIFRPDLRPPRHASEGINRTGHVEKS